LRGESGPHKEPEMVNPIPEGTHTVTPHLIVRSADRAIDFYKQAFGAVEVTRHPSPDGSIMHAELRIGDSPLYLADENPAWGALSPLALGGSPVTIHLFVPDADATFERAVQAGATVRMPIDDAFWGDRYGQVGDPFGHVWSIATHKEDVAPGEMMRRAEEFFASMPPPPKPAPRKKAAAKKAKKKAGAGKKKPARRKKAVRKKKVAGKKPARKKKATRKKAAPKKKAARGKRRAGKPARSKAARRKKRR